MLAYMDESGTLGTAPSDGEWLIVSLVVFDPPMTGMALSAAIDDLRRHLGLPDNYEFHRTHDSASIQKRFEDLIMQSDFKIYVSALKKTPAGLSEGFSRIAKRLVHALAEDYHHINIVADINPSLVPKMREAAAELELPDFRIAETDSKISNLVQVADYIANIGGKLYNLPNFTPPPAYTLKLAEHYQINEVG